MPNVIITKDPNNVSELTVTGAGRYDVDESVIVEALTSGTDYVFSYWERTIGRGANSYVLPFPEPTSPSQTFTMPRQDVKLDAHWVEAEEEAEEAEEVEEVVDVDAD